MHALLLVICVAPFLAIASLAPRAEDTNRSALSVEDDPIAGQRVALVIGNGAYQNANPLPNPENDARDIAAVLKTLGFDVVEGLNLDMRAMDERIERFAEKAETASVTLFYYAGHGIQVDGQNHILPVDVKLETKTSLRFQTVDVDEILRLMAGSKRVAIALLDACRDNPLSRRFAKTRSAAIGRGLAMPRATDGGILIGFATAPGETAADGEGRNSPFAAALVRHLGEPGIEIGQTMKRVMADVVAATDDRQRPWMHSDIAVDFYMRPAPSLGSGSQPAPDTIDALIWSQLAISNDRNQIELFLRSYPQSRFKAEAENKLANLAVVEEQPATKFSDKELVDHCKVAVTNVNGTVKKVDAILQAQLKAHKITLESYNTEGEKQRLLHLEVWSKLAGPDCPVLASAYCTTVAKTYDVTCDY